MLYFCYGLVVAVIVGLDQLTKYLVVNNLALGESMDFIPGLVNLTYCQNTGAAFSMLTGHRWFLIGVSVLCIGFAAGVLAKRLLPPMGAWSLAVVIGGAIGNLIDRIANGYVVDMFEFAFIRFPIFNVADMCVVCGGILLCVCVAFFYRPDTPEKTNDANHG